MHSPSRFSLHVVICNQPRAIDHQPLQTGRGRKNFSMPKVPTQRFGRTFEQHWNAGETPALQQALYGVLDMLNAHRYMPPVEDVADLPTDGISDEVWQAWFPVRNYRDGLFVIPPESPQVLAKLTGRSQDRLLHQAEATAPIVAFDLADHNIEVSLLVFRPASDTMIL